MGLQRICHKKLRRTNKNHAPFKVIVDRAASGNSAATPWLQGAWGFWGRGFRAPKDLVGPPGIFLGCLGGLHQFSQWPSWLGHIGGILGHI
eukprot:1411466-Pyramimonas_sp.AAC.1